MAKLKSSHVYGSLTVDEILNVTQDVIITGDLKVNGTTTTVNSTSITVQDPLIELGGGVDGATLTTQDDKDRGTVLHYYEGLTDEGTAKNAFMGWDHSNGEFALGSEVSITGEVVTFTSYGNIRADVFHGNAFGLTDIQGAQVTGTVALASTATIAGTVTTNAQPNINSVGNLSGLQVGNATTDGTVVISNNGNLVATGNITADYFFGDGSLLTGVQAATAKKTENGLTNVDIPVTNGNITMTVGVEANVVVVSTGGVDIKGYANSTGNMIAQNFVSTGNVEVANAKISSIDSTRVPFANVDSFLVDDSTFTFTTATSLLKSGNLELSANANVNQAIVRSLTSTRVTFAASDKALTDDETFTFTTAGKLLKSGNLEIANIANVDEVIVRSLTAGQVTFADSDKSLTNSANLTFATDTLSVPNATLTGTAQAAEVIVTSLTAGQVTFADSDKSLTNSANLTFATDTLSVPNATLTGTVTAATLKSTDLNSTRVPFTNASNSLTDSANLTFASNTLSVDNVTLVPTGNLTGGNLVSASYLTGTLTTQAQPNITSTGTLTSVTVSGDAVVQGNVKTDNILANATNVTVTAGTNGNITLAPQGTGTVDVSSKRITSVATPTGASDAATKGYVDGLSQGLDIKDSVRAATTTNIDLATNNFAAVDGVTPVLNDRILVRYQTDATENGIYLAKTGSAWVRAADAVQDKISGGSFTFVEEGTTLADTGWVVATNNPITVGTTPISWTQFSAAGTISGGDGLTLTGTTLSVNVDDSTIAIIGDTLQVKDGLTLVTPNIGAATGDSLDIGTGTITANGSLLTNINGANVSEVALATNVTAAAQGNITSVGLLTGLSVDGEVDIGLGAVVANSTGIYTDGYYYADGTEIDFQTAAGSAYQIQFHADGVNDLAASANLTFNSATNVLGVVGTLSVSSTATVGNLATAGTIIGANVTANNLTKLNGIVFSDTDKKLYNNANVFLDTNETLTAPNAYVTSTLTVANISISNDITFSTLANITGANVISATTLSGTLSTAAQTNITSVGTLTGLTSGGVVNLTTASNVALGAVGNVHITGGTSGYILTTDGSGGLSWTPNDTSTIVNGASNVSISTPGGTVKTHVNTALILEVTGTGANVTGILDVTGNINSGNNISAANLITAGGGIDSTSSITGTVKVDGGIAATGNIYTGKSIGFANNNTGTASAAYIQFNATANSLDFIFD